MFLFLYLLYVKRGETLIKLLYCIVLYCIVLFCIVLYCIVLYCIVLYCIVLYCIGYLVCINKENSLVETDLCFFAFPRLQMR